MPPPQLQPGDALPPGTDAVLPLAELVGDGPFAQVLDAVAPGIRHPAQKDLRPEIPAFRALTQ
jgi:hypothetical protein